MPDASARARSFTKHIWLCLRFTSAQRDDGSCWRSMGMAVSFETAQAQAPEDVCWRPPLVGRNRTSLFGGLECVPRKALEGHFGRGWKAVPTAQESDSSYIWLSRHVLTAKCRWNVADPHRLKN
jgi:hypothetical protein